MRWFPGPLDQIEGPFCCHADRHHFTVGETMKRAHVLGAAFVACTAATTTPAAAQTVGADLALFSSYVWLGLRLTNKPVAQADVYVTIPAGTASVTVGASS